MRKKENNEMNDNENSNTEVTKKKSNKWKWIGGVVAFLFIISLFGGGGEEASTAKADKPKETTAASATKSPEVKLTPKQEVQEAVEDAVDGAKVTKDSHGKTYFIEFPVSDNLSNDLIVTGAENDTKEIVKAVVDTGVPVKAVGVRGMFPLTDQYGNTEDGQIMFTFWEKALTKVDWSDEDTVLLLDPQAAAESYGLHPDLQ